MSDDYILGLDLGGTNIKAVTLKGADQSAYAQTTGDGSFAENVRTLYQRICNERSAPPTAIGLAAPGLASPNARSIAFMPGRLQGLENLDWTLHLNAPTPVRVLNDAHAALLGEVALGAAKGAKNVFMLTLGTGVGGAILMDGKLLRGQIGRAGHLGHFSIDINRARDIVGIPGSLEDAIGECTLAARVQNRFNSTRELVEAFRDGDTFAKEIWLRSVNELACGIAGLINILDPEKVVIGGGIANAGSALFDPLAQFLEKLEWRPAGHRVQIVPAKMGEMAGALGAANYAKQHLSDEPT